MIHDTNPQVNTSLLTDVEHFLCTDQNSEREVSLDESALSLAGLTQQVQEAVTHIETILKETADSLSAPPQGDPLGRYEALAWINAAHCRAWGEINAIVDILTNSAFNIRDRGRILDDKIRAYSDVFGFDLPDDLKPQAEDLPF